MDILDEGLIDFWKALNDNNVCYIMVGGFAVNMHGYTRATNDIDMWIKDNLANRRNLAKAMEIFGYADLSWGEIQFIPGWTNFYVGPGVLLGIMIEMKGLEKTTFEEAYKQANFADIQNLKVPFLHINQLIANKIAVNRSKDQLDVIELEKIKELKKEIGLD